MLMTFSGRKTFLIILLTFITAFGINAQTFKGKIISTKGGAIVEFANIMVKSTSSGAASDAKGLFTISLPKDISENTIVITAVGFEAKEISIADLSTKKTNVIAIVPIEYNIDEIDVKAESKVLYGVIKKCAQKIQDNYYTTPYSSEFTYTRGEHKGTGVISDSKGYKRTSFRGSLRQVSYTFNDNNECNNMPYFGGSTVMEDLLSFDLMRTTGNIIDIENVYDFDLEYDNNTTKEDMWIIHFSAREPNLHNTGDAYAKTYEGELYIKKGTYAISQINIRGTSSQRSIHGKSIMLSDKSSQKMTNITYETTVTYKQVNGKYRLNKVITQENFSDTENKRHSIQSSFEVTKELNKYSKITGRDYFVKNL